MGSSFLSSAVGTGVTNDVAVAVAGVPVDVGGNVGSVETVVGVDVGGNVGSVGMMVAVGVGGNVGSVGMVVTVSVPIIGAKAKSAPNAGCIWPV